MTSEDRSLDDDFPDAAPSQPADPEDQTDDLLPSFVHEAEQAYDADAAESAAVGEDSENLPADAGDADAGDAGAGDAEAADEEPTAEPLDAELAAELAEDLQQNLRGVSLTVTPSPAEAASQELYRHVRSVQIEVDPPVTQPLTIGLGGGEWLFVLDRPATDRFRVIRVPLAGGRGQSVAEMEDGSGDNALLDPVGIAVDGDGRLYIPDAEENCVKVFSPDGRWLETIATAGELGSPFDHPRDVDVGTDGHLYVADTYNNRVVKLSLEGELVWEFEQFTNPQTGDAEDELYEPGSVCVSGRTVAIADTNQNRIVAVGTDGVVQSVLESDGSFEFPTEVRVTADGVLYVADHSNLRVQRFAPGGVLTGLIDLRDEQGELSGGGDIDVDPAGNVVMIDPVREAIVVLGFVTPA